MYKRQIVDYSTDSARTAPREVRYTATPRSLEDRTGAAVTTLSNSIDLNDGIFEVASVADLVVGDEFQVDTEVMHITRIVGTTLHVSRGYNQSTIATHTGGAGLLKIDSADNALVESDDDFGFNELYSEFTDGKSRNPIPLEALKPHGKI